MVQMRDTGKLASQLQQQIDYLAEAYGGPTFPPHITLVGGVTGSKQQVLDTAKRLAGIIKVHVLSNRSWVSFIFPKLPSFSTVL